MSKYQFAVEVLPEYLPEQSEPDSEVFSFAYTITITNTGDAPGQLMPVMSVFSPDEGTARIAAEYVAWAVWEHV